MTKFLKGVILVGISDERWDWWEDDERAKDLKVLLQEYQAFGRFPTFEEMRAKHGQMIYNLIWKYGSYEKACSAAGSYSRRLQEKAQKQLDSAGERVIHLKAARKDGRSRGTSGNRRKK